MKKNAKLNCIDKILLMKKKCRRNECVKVNFYAFVMVNNSKEVSF